LTGLQRGVESGTCLKVDPEFYRLGEEQDQDTPHESEEDPACSGCGLKTVLGEVPADWTLFMPRGHHHEGNKKVYVCQACLFDEPKPVLSSGGGHRPTGPDIDPNNLKRPSGSAVWTPPET